MLVTSIKAVIDLLVNLSSERRRSTKANHDLYIEPCYQAIKIVFSDYKKLFNKMKRSVKSTKSLPRLVEILDKGREETLAHRLELRAAIAACPEPSEFEKSILAVLSGPFRAAHSLGHLRLSLLHFIKAQNNKKQYSNLAEESEIREHLLLIIDQSSSYIEEAFRNVTFCYANSKSKLIPKRKKIRNS